MKPILFCLEDFEIHRAMLELRLRELLGDQVELRFFRSLQQLQACTAPCDVLISDLKLGDASAEQTASFLRQFCTTTPVLVQSSEIHLPNLLEHQHPGRIYATEKAGYGQRFEQALLTLLADRLSPATPQRIEEDCLCHEPPRAYMSKQ